MNCYDNMITGGNRAVSHISRSLWDNARGRWRSEKKFPSKWGGTIGESCHYRAWQLHRWAKYVLPHPPIVLRSYHPAHHLVSVRTGLSLFLLEQRGDTMRGWRNRTGTKTSIIELCLWNLEPAANTLEAILPFLFWWPDKDVWFVWGWENGFHSIVLLWNTCFLGRKLFHFCSFFLFLFCLVFCLLVQLFFSKLNLWLPFCPLSYFFFCLKLCVEEKWPKGPFCQGKINL